MFGQTSNINQPLFALCESMQLTDVSRVAAIEAQTNSSAWPAQVFAAQLALPYSYSLVARYQQQVIGFCVYWVVADEMQLLSIATAPPQQRRGIGSLLLDAARAHAVQQGAATITLEVRATNGKALAMYRRMGFREQGTRTAYYQNGDDAVLMAVAIGP